MGLKLQTDKNTFYTLPFVSFNADFSMEIDLLLPGSKPEAPTCLFCLEESGGSVNSLIAVYSDYEPGNQIELILDVYDDTGVNSQDTYPIVNEGDFVQAVSHWKLERVGANITLTINAERGEIAVLTATLTDTNCTLTAFHIGGFLSTIYGGPSGIVQKQVGYYDLRGDIIEFGTAYDPNGELGGRGSKVETIDNDGSFGGLFTKAGTGKHWKVLQQKTQPGTGPPPPTTTTHKPKGQQDLKKIQGELKSKFGIESDVEPTSQSSGFINALRRFINL